MEVLRAELALLLITIAGMVIQTIRLKLQEKKSKLPSATVEFINAMNLEINQFLAELLVLSKSNRVCLFQFHNGEVSLANYHLMKMSMTNEVVQEGYSKEIEGFQSISINPVTSFIEDLINKKQVTHNTSEIKEASIRFFFQDRGSLSVICNAIFNRNNNLIGFVCVDYVAREFDTKNKDIQHVISKYSEKIAYKMEQSLKNIK